MARIYIAAWRNAYAGLVPDSVLLAMDEKTHQARWNRTFNQQDEERAFVAEWAGEVVGIATCGPGRKPDFGYTSEVYVLYVDHDHHGLGLGKALLRACFDDLAARGHENVLIWVLSGNPARYFYAARGGRIVAERVEKLWGVELDETGYGWTGLSGPESDAAS